MAKHKPEWEELENLLRAAGRHPRRLAPQQLNRLDILYRRTITTLAQASARTSNESLIEYLNNLAARAHGAIHRPVRRGWLAATGMFFLDGFPRLVLKSWRYHAISAGLMLAGALLAYGIVRHDPTAAYALMPQGEFRLPGATREQLLDALRHGRDEGHGMKFLFASALFTHNLKVSCMAMATGMLAAIPTVLLIFYNGMILGAFTATHAMKGIYGEYWAWILPHGVSELSAIVLFGGCGLKLGWRWIHPGWQSRTEALLETGRETFGICAGGGAMLVFAALAESYIRQSTLSTESRLLFAAAVALFWGGYFLRPLLFDWRAARLAAATADSVRG